MRLGVIADVHANLRALDAALGALDRLGIDRIACAGDVVGYGASPNECVARLQERDVGCIAGNHDLVAVEAAGLERCGALAQVGLEWTRSRLTPASRAWLRALPGELRLEDVVIAHGALGDPWRYLFTEDDMRAELGRLTSYAQDATVLVVGHTHRAALVDSVAGRVGLPAGRTVHLESGLRYLLNPGAVGQSRGWRARARCAVLDTTARSVQPIAVRYDVAGCRRELAEAGLPPEGCHARPGVRPTARAAARRLGRGLRAERVRA